MLTITHDAVEAIRAVMGPREGGLRITAAPEALNGRGPGLALEAVAEPDPEDAVIDAEGAHLYLDSAAVSVLDGKVLDAEPAGEGVRFSVVEPT